MVCKGEVIENFRFSGVLEERIRGLEAELQPLRRECDRQPATVHNESKCCERQLRSCLVPPNWGSRVRPPGYFRMILQ